jgi:hypothetical protein
VVNKWHHSVADGHAFRERNIKPCGFSLRFPVRYGGTVTALILISSTGRFLDGYNLSVPLKSSRESQLCGVMLF